MTEINTKRPLHCIMLLFYVARTFGLSGDLSSDKPFGVGAGLGIGRYHSIIGLGPSQTRPTESGEAWHQSRSHYNDSDVNPSEQSQPSPAVTTYVDVNLSEAGGVKNSSSELSKLFSVRSDNAYIDSSSQTRAITLERSSIRTEPSKPITSDVVSLNMTYSRTGRPTPSLSPTPLVVPSEGGLMQDLSISPTEARDKLLKDESSPDHGFKLGPIGTEVKDNESRPPRPTVGLTPGLDLDLPVGLGVNKHPVSEDSHISARKGANLSEKTEPRPSVGTILNDTAEQFTFGSSEIPFVKGNRTQKITPRKGAEPTKIFPRKGVQDQIENFGSSDQFFSEMNITTASIPISTVITTGSPTQTVGSIPWPTSIYSNHPPGDDAVQNITDMFQNRSGIELTQKASRPRPTPSLSSVSSGQSWPNAFEATTPSPTSNSDTQGASAVKESNVSLAVTPTLIGSLNNTLAKLVDQSGIVASYPPLKKRLKPLKTTDVHALNSSPVPPEHTPGGHDYVVPIVVTILTVPMLVVLALFLYKKGSEFWERRHYRRMDFLIDGIYND